MLIFELHHVDMYVEEGHDVEHITSFSRTHTTTRFTGGTFVTRCGWYPMSAMVKLATEIEESTSGGIDYDLVSHPMTYSHDKAVESNALFLNLSASGLQDQS